MSLHIYQNEETLANGLAAWLAGNISLVLKTRERYSFVLSGGSTPKKLYHILARDYISKVDWGKVDFFFGDERFVPFDDDRNNGKMAYETLLTPLAIPEENIYRMPTQPTPEQAAADYEKTLKGYLRNNSDTTFDFTLLGMGADGHTLSVFPDSPLLDSNSDWVKSVFNTGDQLQRITLLPHLVNRSQTVAFMIKGADKAKTLYNVLGGKYEPAKLPARLIEPRDGILMWFIDRAAAGDILQ